MPASGNRPALERGGRKNSEQRHDRRETRAQLRGEKKQFEGRALAPAPSARPPQSTPSPSSSAPLKPFVPNLELASLPGKIIQGRVDIHPDGFGFLIAKDPKIPNLYIGEENLKNVMHRDEVMARVEKSFEGGTKLRGTVISIARRAQKEFLGVYRPFKGGALIVPLEARDRKHSFRLAGTPPADANIKAGTAVLCKVLSYPDKGQGSAEIVSVLEDPAAPSNDTLRVLLEAGWPREFSRVALGEAEGAAQGWQQRLLPRRKDIRHLPLVTIDGRDAKDFDDAVCAKAEGSNIRLWVAIADVSLFVKPGTALDDEAFGRSTSVYFPDHVVPMLPEVLSNGVCSLNPHEDRACLVAEMVINAQGQCMNYEFYEGLMQSQRRMTYEDMQAFIEDASWAREELTPIQKDNLTTLVDVYRRLRKAKERRGAIDLEIPEAKVSMNRDGTILDIQPRERLEAHRLIEECMLIANGAAAQFLEAHGEGVYRIHEQPDPKRVEDLRKFVALAGFDVKDLEQPGDFAALMGRVSRELGKDDPTGRAISTLVLRSLKQARYSTVRVGHFALATDDYTHFTSPIRRYPDLMVHRLIKQGLKYEAAIVPRGLELESACQHCSDQERAAMDCERKLIDTKKCRYMEHHLGEEFDAWISGVTEKGMFCQIDGHFVDGLINAEGIYRAVKHRFDPELLSYVGPGKSRIGLGTRVRVMLAAVDVASRKIDFGLVEILSKPN